MAELIANWILGSPITAQRISVKKRDDTVWSNSGFGIYELPSNTLITNDIGATVNNVRIDGLLFNTVYDIRVENVYFGAVNSCKMISQGIEFNCNDNAPIAAPIPCHQLPPTNNLFITNVTNTSFDVQVTNLTNYIDKVKFFLYDYTGTTLITSSSFINTSSNQASTSFTGLVANTGYRVYYQMASTITNNNVTGDKVSDIFGAERCFACTITTNTTSLGFVTLFNNATPTGCTTTVDITDGVNTYQIQATGSGVSANIQIPYGTYDITISKPCNCNPLIDDFDCNGIFNSAGTFTGIVLNSTNSIDCTAHCI